MPEEPIKYVLAWHRKFIADCQRELVYILVPRSLSVFRGSLDVEAINDCGRPIAGVTATMKDLAVPRTREDTEGIGHQLEQRLIHYLASRSMRAGHVLPDIYPTLRYPSWARLELTETQRKKLLLAGGITP